MLNSIIKYMYSILCFILSSYHIVWEQDKRTLLLSTRHNEGCRIRGNDDSGIYSPNTTVTLAGLSTAAPLVVPGFQRGMPLTMARAALSIASPADFVTLADWMHPLASTTKETSTEPLSLMPEAATFFLMYAFRNISPPVKVGAVSCVAVDSDGVLARDVAGAAMS